MASDTVAARPSSDNRFRGVEISADLTFFEASDLYLRLRTLESLPVNSSARFISKRTVSSYQQYTKSLNLFFAEIRLRDIHAGYIRAYQHARLNGTEPFIRRRRPHEEPKPSPCGPIIVNHELTFLKMVMSRAEAWTPGLEKDYEPLRFDQADVPRALSPDEQNVWLEISKLKERWAVVHYYSVLAFATCINPNELYTAKIGNLNLFHQVLTISARSAKNRHRVRTIPLVTPEALWAAEQLIARAKECGATDPQHYLFPFRQGNGPWDVLRPMTGSGIKKSWEEVQQATGLLWFNPYGTRHTAITRLAEAGVAVDTIMSMAGHVSERMRRHYTHISDQAKIHALRQAQNVQAGKPVQQAARRSVPSPSIPQMAPRSTMATASTFSWGLNWTGST
jgi:integrase